MLEWMGKKKVVNHHNDVPFHVLERKYSFDATGKHEKDNGSGNMIIHGDNLVALKSLLPRFEGRVKCIYIDPPYNTGNECWVYNDNVNDPQIKKWLGEVVGKEGEDFSRHDKWLCMMYPRLKLLQKLLAKDGAIFISIDDVEVANLRLLCDEIFGSGNHLGTFVWQKRYSPDVRRAISDAHEYVLCYGKDPDAFKRSRNLLPLTKAQTKQFSNPDHDPRGPWKANDFTAPGYRPNQMYEITLPSGRVVTPPKGRCWRVTKEGFDRFVAENRMIYGTNGDGVPAVKRFLSEMPGMVPWTWLNCEDVGHSQEGNNQLAAILGKAVFNYPKPVRLIERFVRIATEEDSIVLDSFAGSGTTAHAVLKLNHEDGGRRKFILVEMDDYAETITAERVRRVTTGYGSGKSAAEGTGGDFSFYELGPQLMVDGVLNEEVPTEKIREYVWYTETKGAGLFNSDKSEATLTLRKARNVSGASDESELMNKRDDKYLLGVAFGVAYYFCYEKDKSMTLNRTLLKKIKTKAESYVVYADACTLSAEELEKLHITFKKIPRDVTRF